MTAAVAADAPELEVGVAEGGDVADEIAAAPAAPQLGDSAAGPLAEEGAAVRS